MSEELKTANVEKPVPVAYDLGNLAAFDINPLDETLIKDAEQKETHLKAVARDNVQLIVNQLLQLPIHKSTAAEASTVRLFALPEPTTQLPREKSLPKPKAATKWEQFALRKGIQSKAKDGKLVFDEVTGKWVPKWGFNGKNKQLDNQWLVEVDESKTKTKEELVDPRKLGRMERKFLVKKQQKRMDRNR